MLPSFNDLRLNGLATPKCKLIKVKFLKIDLIGRDTRYMYIMYMHGCSINLINFKWRIFQFFYENDHNLKTVIIAKKPLDNKYMYIILIHLKSTCPKFYCSYYKTLINNYDMQFHFKTYNVNTIDNVILYLKLL